LRKRVALQVAQAIQNLVFVVEGAAIELARRRTGLMTRIRVELLTGAVQAALLQNRLCHLQLLHVVIVEKVRVALEGLQENSTVALVLLEYDVS